MEMRVVILWDQNLEIMEKKKDSNPILPTNNTESLPDNFIIDVRNIIENGRKKAYDAVVKTSIRTFWDVGKRIVEEEQKGKTRAKYGTHLIKNLSYILIPIYGNSYNNRFVDNGCAYVRKPYI